MGTKGQGGHKEDRGAEKERDEAKKEAQVARLAAFVAGDAKAKPYGDLTRVQDALAATEEARVIVEEAKRKAKAKVARLEVMQTSLLLEIGTAKDEVSSLHSQVGKDKEAMEEDYHKALVVIFAYGYGCCIFKHNICGDKPEVPVGMPDFSDPLPPEFFVSPRLPPILTAIRDTAIKAHPSEVAKEPEGNASA